jgi:hypothetical protein
LLTYSSAAAAALSRAIHHGTIEGSTSLGRASAREKPVFVEDEDEMERASTKERERKQQRTFFLMIAFCWFAGT